MCDSQKGEQLDYEFLIEALKQYYLIRVQALAGSYNLSSETQVIMLPGGIMKILVPGNDPYIARLAKSIKTLEAESIEEQKAQEAFTMAYSINTMAYSINRIKGGKL